MSFFEQVRVCKLGSSGRYYPSACLYSCEDNDYDKAKFVDWGLHAELDREKIDNALYIDKLLEKVENLFSNESKTALDRLHQRAVIQYFKELISYVSKEFSDRSFGGESIQIKYVITYPTDWNPKKIAYLRSLVLVAIGKNNDSDCIIMCDEGEAILYYVQEPYNLGTQVKQGQKYLICDLGSTKVKMSLYDIKEPLDAVDGVNRVSRCDWNLDFGEQPPQLQIGAQGLFKQLELFLLPKLSTVLLKELSLEDFLNEGGFLYDHREHFKWLIEEFFCDISYNWKKKIIENKPYYCKPPIQVQSDQPVLTTPENTNRAHQERHRKSSPEEMSLEFYSREIEKKVFHQCYSKIIQYVKGNIRAASDSIDGVILVGGLSERKYIRELLPNACGGIKTDIYGEVIVNGAILKFVGEAGAREFKPEIVYDSKELSLYSQSGQTQQVFVFIDYGLEKVRVSYICVQPGENVNIANVKHIKDWPGQHLSNFDLSTIDLMLIPSNDSDRKKIVSLQGIKDHKEQYLKYSQAKYAEYEYYTFEKDKQGIILVTHKRSAIRNDPNKDMEDLSSFVTGMQNTQSDIDQYAIVVTRKYISAPEFALLYFDYLTPFIYDYLKSKTGAEIDLFRFCITQDSQACPVGLTLSDKNIYEIAHKTKIISTDDSNTLLVLDRAQAVAIHCRTMIDISTAKQGESYLHFLQLHLLPNRCVLLLNNIPLPDDKENSINKEDGKPWESICKYAKTKNISMNMINILSENLWKHIQKYQHALLQKCKRHRSSRTFFNLQNMEVFKKLLLEYITLKTLDLENSELEQEIDICDKGDGRCCRMRIANIDILEFGIIPAINQLVSFIQASVSNQKLFHGIQISNIFVIGEFLHCQDHASYSLLEQLLLSKIKKINFRRLDNLILQKSNRKVTVTKINGQEKQQVGQVDDKAIEYKSIELASMNGSLLYGLDPRNRLVERFAGKSFALISGMEMVRNDGTTESKRDGLIPISRKGTPLANLTSFRNNAVYFWNNQLSHSRGNLLVSYINLLLYAAETDNDSSLDPNNIRDKFELCENHFIENPTFPIIFKAQMPQDGSYKFWVEYGINEREYFDPLKERILLTSFHHYK